jgi:hypothetical protein
MEFDDPGLEKAHKEMTARVGRYNDRIVEVLKGHLSVEQSLIDVLRTARRKWKRPFAGKIDIAVKLFCPDLTVELWDVVKAGNNLRNAVAHGHKEGTVTQRKADLRGALLAWASPTQRPDLIVPTRTGTIQRERWNEIRCESCKP